MIQAIPPVGSGYLPLSNVATRFDFIIDMSNAKPKAKNRHITVRTRHKSALEARAGETSATEGHQIREALEVFSQIVPTNAHRALLSLDGDEHRKHIPIPDELWEQLKARKKRYGLLLEDQIEIALALYFGEKPPAEEPAPVALEPAPIEEQARRAAREELQTLLESGAVQLAAPEAFAAGAYNPLAAAKVIRIAEPNSSAIRLRSFEAVPCGPWREVLDEAEPLDLPADIAAVLGARPGDLVFPTKGQSMVKAGVPDEGRVVMRPLEGRVPLAGAIVLFCIERENGAWESTLKFYFGEINGVPQLRDGALKLIQLPKDTQNVYLVAQLVGVMGRATMGTVKGNPTERVQPRVNRLENLESE